MVRKGVSIEVIDFIQDQLDNGLTNALIVGSLLHEHDITIGVRQLSRLIHKNALTRPLAISASDRADAWLLEVQALIKRGIKLVDILYHLEKEFGGDISLRTLKKVLQVPPAQIIGARLVFKYRRIRFQGNISIRQNLSPELVEMLVLVESRGDGEALGCRAMMRRIREIHDALVTRDAVNAAQRSINPTAVACRCKQRLLRREYTVAGPNALWHFDQNDKLRQFGFEIHCAIDGWSRQILWLQVSPNNRIPELVLAYYMDAVIGVGCMPALQRSDRAVQSLEKR